jgi:hypothetical protein
MTIARSARVTWAELEQHTRVLLEDPLNTPAGDPRPILQWQTWQVYESLNAACRELQTELAIDHQGEFLEAVELTYVENATRTGMTLPANLARESIAFVEDISDENRKPLRVRYATPEEVGQYDSDVEAANTPAPRRTAQAYTLVSENASAAIIIRPQPVSGNTFRIWVERAPLEANDPADLHPLSMRWRDLICLMAAFNLRGIIDDLPEGMIVRMNALRDQFRRSAATRRGPQRVVNRRFSR